jgi:hypothetical protein
MKFQTFATFLTLAILLGSIDADENQCTHDDAPTLDSACSPSGLNPGVVYREISYVLLAVSGTLEEGFELRKNMGMLSLHSHHFLM